MSEDNVAVAIRVRPVIKSELKEEWTVCGNEISLIEPAHRDIETSTFTFDYILDASKTNEDLYNIVRPLVCSALNGVNATIFAYGQTSSGKTHSILGSEVDPGVIPRAAQNIFAGIQENRNSKYIVRVSYVEIYNEKINDLLNVHNKDLKMRVSDDGKGSVLLGMHEEIVHDEDAMIAIVQKGSKNRQVGETKMNERSSRSHVICDILIESSKGADSPVKAAHLYIVDLAGCERISQTGATGARLNEGVHINKSLSTLISVITQLSNGQSFVSYRDSKLTRLLANALGGNSRTLIVVTITPVSIDDSLSTLKFARSAKTIKNKPKMNEILSQESIIKRQRNRESELLRELSEKGDLIEKLNAELEESRKIYVPPKRKIPVRRHTMGTPSDTLNFFSLLEPIREDAVNFDYKENLSTSISTLESIMEESRCEDDEEKLLPPPPVRMKHYARNSITTEQCDRTLSIDSGEYQELMKQYTQLDQSHASLKEFTQLEMDVKLQERINEETAYFRKENERLRKECIRFQEECVRLKRSYEVLDISHVDLRDFTKIEVDLAVEERTQQLQKEVDELQKFQLCNTDFKHEHDKLLERLSTTEAERDILNSHQERVQRRCNELIARIQELENESQLPPELSKSISSELSAEDTRFKTLQERCAKLEASMKLAEIHSKILLEENNAIKGNKQGLRRSLSETNLSFVGDICEDELTKAEFQRIFKSLRKLMSTIISGSDLQQSGLDTQMTMTQLSPLVRLGGIRTKCEKSTFTFSDRMSNGLQEEEIEHLKKENCLLKEHTSELLEKLRILNDDKLSVVEITTYKEQIERLQDEKITLEEILKQNKIKQDEWEEKVKQLESDMKDCENMMEYHQGLQAKINELTNELNKIKIRQSTLPNQNAKFIQELQEKLRIDNEAQQEKEVIIKNLQEELAQKEDKEVETLKELSGLFQEHQNAVERLRLLSEGNNSDHQSALGKVQKQVNELQEQLKQKQSEHDMDKEALEYSSTELDEAMAKIIELQTKLKSLQNEFDETLTRTTKELEMYKSCKAESELFSVKVEELEHELEKINSKLVNVNDQLAKSQTELETKLEDCMISALKISELEANAMESSTKLNDLQKETDALNLDKVKHLNDFNALQALASEKDEAINKLQKALNERTESVQDQKKRAESAQIVYEKNLEDKTQFIREQTEKINILKDEVERMKSSHAEDCQQIGELTSALKEKQGEILGLRRDVDTGNEEFEKMKMKAEEVQHEYQQEISRLHLQIDELKANQGENKNELACIEEHLKIKDMKFNDLQLQLANSKQECHELRIAAKLSTEEHNTEIEKFESKLEKLNGEIDMIKKLKDDEVLKFNMSMKDKEGLINELQNSLKVNEESLLQAKNTTTKTQQDQQNELKLLLADKEARISKLRCQLESTTQQYSTLIIAADKSRNDVQEYEKTVLNLKDDFKFQLQECKDRIISLEEEVEQKCLLQLKIKDLSVELGSVKEDNNTIIAKANLLETELDTSRLKELKSFEERRQLKSDFDECTMKLKSLEEALTCTQKDHHISLDTIHKLKMEVSNLKENEQNVIAIIELKSKHEHAVTEITQLKEKLYANKIKEDDWVVKEKFLENKVNAVVKDYRNAQDKVKQLQYELDSSKKDNENINRFKDLDQKYEQVVSQIATYKSEIATCRNLNKDYVTKLKLIETQLEDSQQERKCSLSTIKNLENELNIQKKLLDGNEIKELDLKYQQAVTEIATLKNELLTNKKMNITDARKGPRYNAIELEQMNVEERAEKAMKELLLTRHELRMERHWYSQLKKEHEAFKIATETKTKEEPKSKGPVLLPFAKCLRSANRKKEEAAINEQNSPMLSEAASKIKILKEDLKYANDKIKELGLNFKKVTEESKNKYDQLMMKYNQLIINNPSNSIEDQSNKSEVDSLKTEHETYRKFSERQVIAMTEDFERKYKAYSDKYAMLKRTFDNTTRNKDAIIKELEFKLEESNKENRNRQANNPISLLELNKISAKSALQITDLRKQLHAAQQEVQKSAASYEMQLSRLKEEHQKKLEAVNTKLNTSYNQINVQTDTEMYAKRINAELSIIPSKMTALRKITSVNVSNVCDKCTRFHQLLADLNNNKAVYPVWCRFEPDGTCIERDDMQMQTTRFDSLVESRSMYDQLVKFSSMTEAQELLSHKLKCTHDEIERYMFVLKEKKDFLSALHENLKSFLVAGAEVYQHSRDLFCEYCEYFRQSFHVGCAIAEKIKCSMVIIGNYENQMNPHPSCIEMAKSYDEKIAKLLIKLDDIKKNISNGEIAALSEKYKHAKRVAESLRKDTKLLASVLNKENYTVNLRTNPIQIRKISDTLNPALEDKPLDEDNPRPSLGRSREFGRKSFGATPKHFSPFFITPDEHKEAKHEARRNK